MIDIKQSTDGDVDLATGDIQMTEPTEQHKRDIILSAKGDNREYPVVGVCAVDYIHDNDPMALLRECRRQFAGDGMKVREVGYENGELIVDAAYEDSNS